MACSAEEERPQALRLKEGELNPSDRQKTGGQLLVIHAFLAENYRKKLHIFVVQKVTLDYQND